MTTDNSRKEFEKWCLKNGYSEDGHDIADGRWEAWQASRAAPDAVIEKLVEALGFYAGSNEEGCKQWESRMKDDLGYVAGKALALAEAYRKGADHAKAD